jgi:hypothetical protein
MFKKLIGIWVVVLILGAASLGKSPQPQPQRVTTTAQPSPKAATPSVPVICNETDMACRKEAAERLKQKHESDATWQFLVQNPEYFCETFKSALVTATGVNAPCLTEDPTYRAVRDGVEHAIRSSRR